MAGNNVQLPQDPKAAIEGVLPTVVEDSLSSFSTSRLKFQQLVTDWDMEIKQTEKNRITRDLDFNVDALREEGSLDEDETIIPDRVIDTNIQRELPPYVNYIKNSRRLAIFSCLTKPSLNTDNLEQAFTAGMSYSGWEIPHFKVLDGSCTHGWDACEVTFDATKPLHVAIEQVGHDRLFWPRTAMKLEQAKYVIRAYDYTLLELKQFITKYGWSREEVDKITNSVKDTAKSAEAQRIFKVLYKRDADNVIMIGWFSLEKGCGDWLKAPVPLYLGIDSMTLDAQGNKVWTKTPITQYPFFILPYRESEKPRLTDRKGRVFLDGNKQEAKTGILSAFINGMQRASHLRASPKQDDGTGNSVSADEIKSIGGAVILPKPMDYYYLPYPDPQTLTSLEYLDNSNAQETNQVNFAVMNRQDSRKTAKEIETANQQSSMLNSVQLTLFSTYFRSVYSFVWLIVQSQAMQGLIKFLQTEKQVDPQMPSQLVNDFDTLQESYDLRAAGDVDVIQRQELLAQMKQDWGVFQSTPLAQMFLEDLIRLSYPAQADKYIAVMRQGNQQQMQQMTSLVKGLAETVKGFMKDAPQAMQSLPPDQVQHLTQMIQAADAVGAQPSDGQQGGTQ